jgi:cardiolipin synthase (CMP-forming)
VITLPNLITLLRLFTVPLFAYLVLDGKIAWAFLVLFVASFSDWLDGYLARRLNQYSLFGEKLDPIVDRLYIITLVIVGLIIEALIPIFVILIISREVYMAVLMLLVKRKGYLGLPVNYIGKMASFCLMGGLPLSLIATEYDLANQLMLTTAYAFVLWGLLLYLWASYYYTKQYLTIRIANA